MTGKQLKQQQEYRFTQLIPNLGVLAFTFFVFCCKNAELGQAGHTSQLQELEQMLTEART